MYNSVDEDKSGTINLPEFRQWVQKVKDMAAKVEKGQMVTDFLKKTFEELDADKSGQLSLAELINAMKAKSEDLTKALGNNFLYMMNSVDEDHNRKVTFDEFNAWADKVYQAQALQVKAAAESASTKVKDAVASVFSQVDVDGSGTVSKIELMKALGGKAKTDLQNLMGKNFFYMYNSADEDQSGQISLPEFRGWVDKVKALAVNVDKGKMVSDFLKKTFTEVDTDNGGTLTMGELMKAMQSKSEDLTKALGKNFLYLMSQVDVDQERKISLKEFEAWADKVYQAQVMTVEAVESQNDEEPTAPPPPAADGEPANKKQAVEEEVQASG